MKLGREPRALPKLIAFRCAAPHSSPLLAVPLKQVVEVAVPDGVIGVDDPRSVVLGFAKHRDDVVPVLDPRGWGGAERPFENMRRLLFVRGARENRVAAIPIADLWIESLSPTTEKATATAPSALTGMQFLAVVRLRDDDAFLLDLDALIREQLGRAGPQSS